MPRSSPLVEGKGPNSEDQATSSSDAGWDSNSDWGSLNPPSTPAALQEAPLAPASYSLRPPPPRARPSMPTPEKRARSQERRRPDMTRHSHKKVTQPSLAFGSELGAAMPPYTRGTVGSPADPAASVVPHQHDSYKPYSNDFHQYPPAGPIYGPNSLGISYGSGGGSGYLGRPVAPYSAYHGQLQPPTHGYGALYHPGPPIIQQPMEQPAAATAEKKPDPEFEALKAQVESFKSWFAKQEQQQDDAQKLEQMKQEAMKLAQEELEKKKLDEEQRQQMYEEARKQGEEDARRKFEADQAAEAERKRLQEEADRTAEEKRSAEINEERNRMRAEEQLNKQKLEELERKVAALGLQSPKSAVHVPAVGDGRPERTPFIESSSTNALDYLTEHPEVPQIRHERRYSQFPEGFRVQPTYARHPDEQTRQTPVDARPPHWMAEATPPLHYMSQRSAVNSHILDHESPMPRRPFQKCLIPLRTPVNDPGPAPEPYRTPRQASPEFRFNSRSASVRDESRSDGLSGCGRDSDLSTPRTSYREHELSEHQLGERLSTIHVSSVTDSRDSGYAGFPTKKPSSYSVVEASEIGDLLDFEEEETVISLSRDLQDGGKDTAISRSFSAESQYSTPQKQDWSEAIRRHPEAQNPTRSLAPETAVQSPTTDRPNWVLVQGHDVPSHLDDLQQLVPTQYPTEPRQHGSDEFKAFHYMHVETAPSPFVSEDTGAAPSPLYQTMRAPKAPYSPPQSVMAPTPPPNHHAHLEDHDETEQMHQHNAQHLQGHHSDFHKSPPILNRDVDPAKIQGFPPRVRALRPVGMGGDFPRGMAPYPSRTDSGRGTPRGYISRHELEGIELLRASVPCVILPLTFFQREEPERVHLSGPSPSGYAPSWGGGGEHRMPAGTRVGSRMGEHPS